LARPQNARNIPFPAEQLDAVSLHCIIFSVLGGGVVAGHPTVVVDRQPDVRLDEKWDVVEDDDTQKLTTTVGIGAEIRAIRLVVLDEMICENQQPAVDTSQ
jgi:hypothetical protein